ncbi:MAG TPA: GNAT family N-acetyltransferase, partial [Firmicutes bacterium]|nr:GNAT family N-acetyltransferase [Bacillota bacterium]
MRVFTPDTLFLARPSVAYAETFIDALREFHNEGYFAYQNIDEIAADFPAFVDQLLADETRDATADRVPETYYWLIRRDRDTDTFVARGSIRHELTEHLRHIGGHIGYAVRPSERRK